MAITTTLVSEGKWGTARAKAYKFVHDGSTTSVTITPGAGYVFPMGSFTNYSSTGSGAFTLSIGAQTNTSVGTVVFLGP